MDPIERVREGMRVLDMTGTYLGTVAEVRFADRAMARSPSPGFPSDQLSLPTEGTGRAQARPRPGGELLEHLGYVRVDAEGLLGEHICFSADDIIAVQRDTVHITRRAGGPAPKS